MPPHPSAASSHPAHALGRWGERHAASFLERRGWHIVARNYRFGRREVDLVARRDGILAFVEVKTRAGEGFGDPLEAITWRKRREVEAVAAHFLAHRGAGGSAPRFDAVSVTRFGDGGIRVVHVPDAWRPGWP